MFTSGEPPLRRSIRYRNQLSLRSSDSMSPLIWGKLPEDILELVGARLSVATFYRFLSVNRKWNSILTSNTFLEHYAEVPVTRPWFYIFTYNNLKTAAMYDPSSKKWHHPKIHTFREKLFLIPVASSGSIICFVNIGPTHFYVGNPLNQNLKELPPRSNTSWSQVAVGMWMNGKTADKGYKIITLSGEGMFEIFNSIERKWGPLRAIPTTISLPLNLNLYSQSIMIDDCVYFMCLNPARLISYDTLSGAWNHFFVPMPCVLIGGQFLAESGGRILLVSRMLKKKESCVSVMVWELQKMTLLWEEVDRMPKEWCLEYCGTKNRMICLGNKDLIMLSFRSKKVNMQITYDVQKKEWLQTPPSILPRGRTRQKLEGGTAFYPSIVSKA